MVANWRKTEPFGGAGALASLLPWRGLTPKLPPICKELIRLEGLSGQAAM
jgi:hypothetical protein